MTQLAIDAIALLRRGAALSALSALSALIVAIANIDVWNRWNVAVRRPVGSRKI